MERLADLLFDELLDPVVLTASFLVTGALVSGLAARIVELWEDVRPQPRRPAASLRRKVTWC